MSNQLQMNKVKITSILFCVALLLIFIGVSFSQTEENLLKSAYEHNSKIILDEFFYKWQLQTPPIPYAQFQNLSDTEMTVYDIYYAFCNSFVDNSIKPFKLENYDKLFKNIKYLILQDKLNFEVEESENFEKEYFARLYTHDTVIKVTKDSITDFRPEIIFKNLQVVFLTADYYRLFNDFFDNKFQKNNSIFETNDSLYLDYNSKVKFLSNHTSIIHKGNIGVPRLYYYELLTDPIIQKVVLHDDFQKAKVYFSITCLDYVAYFNISKNGWKLTNCILLGEC